MSTKWLYLHPLMQGASVTKGDTLNLLSPFCLLFFFLSSLPLERCNLISSRCFLMALLTYMIFETSSRACSMRSGHSMRLLGGALR